jgi:hypothetical protein
MHNSSDALGNDCTTAPNRGFSLSLSSTTAPPLPSALCGCAPQRLSLFTRARLPALVPSPPTPNVPLLARTTPQELASWRLALAELDSGPSGPELGTAAAALAALRDAPPLASLPGSPVEASRLLPGLVLPAAPLTALPSPPPSPTSQREAR